MSPSPKPRLLDLFCGAGGAAMGYSRAGFEVVGVDIKPQPHFPFPWFIRGDALEALQVLVDGTSFNAWFLEDFDAIHASPPCQAYTSLKSVRQDYNYPDLLEPTRELLEQTGLPYVIENVPGSPIRGTLMLCGSSFGLGSGNYYLRRHRYFETNWDLGTLVPPCQHGREAILVAGHTSMTKVKPNGQARSYQGNAEERSEAMAIDWMNRDELAQAIPPAYTEFIGQQLMQHLIKNQEFDAERDPTQGGVFT
jgi:DNA (cytosine-5)-methyltransferase 1